MKNIGIILSGGNGSRFGGPVPKQFAKLAGRCVIEYTIDAFENTHDIDEIIVVSKADYVEFVWSLVNKNHWEKVVKVIAGGEDRFTSTYSAIQSLMNYPGKTKVLFHDSVRPLVNEQIIRECINKLDVFSAVDVVIPSSDTLIQVGDDGCIKDIPPRDLMRRGQTPQGFLLETIREAYKLAIEKDRRNFTCDCGVVRAMLPHIKIATTDGTDSNQKVTHTMDLFTIEKMLQARSNSFRFDPTLLKNLKGKNIIIFGGSSGIGKAIHDLATLNGARAFSASRTQNGIDISKRETIEAFLSSVIDSVGKIDIVINTAALLIKKPLEKTSPEEINAIISTNYLGMINIALSAHKFLKESKGTLLNFTSSSYTRGRAYYSLYSSTKSAAVNFTQALADEWSKDAIRVNCINPERTQTPMRVTNFGLEDPSLLLKAEDVAETSLLVALMRKTGMIVDIKKEGALLI
ncbi:bifunctional cytidylyltransferase/SDR family oxidoreductase [Chromobacterium haemolyticum]|uniref:bifunctional cytidylyltransferase/SDR family oxidoreductase n=3 Tax=Chromobacterium haemolyticum TaxID=394935 RepID=UPI002446B45C|nr:bifunctional cytidylyltransferase/SDR family oxidoreductase [Chromobacterium haemolyticum]MDH0341904.1 bifunctional cytidylyltransferase/SDR family oxidoreductase [Chromobacterium haemolyticum]